MRRRLEKTASLTVSLICIAAVGPSQTVVSSNKTKGKLNLKEITLSTVISVVEEAIESYSLFLIVTKELNIKKKLERIC